MTPRASHSRRKHLLTYLLIYGAGGHAQVVAEAATAAGWRVAGFLDDGAPAGQMLGGLPVLRPTEVLGRPAPKRGHAPRPAFIVAIGDNAVRQRVQGQLVAAGVKLASVVHPAAWVSPSAEVGAGVFVGAMGVINTQARLGDGVIVNSGALVEHHNQIGEFAHIAPHAALAGQVSVGALSLIGIGACVRPGITIGQRCTVGAGAAVVRDVANNSTVVGVPARRRRG